MGLARQSAVGSALILASAAASRLARMESARRAVPQRPARRASRHPLDPPARGAASEQFQHLSSPHRGGSLGRSATQRLVCIGHRGAHLVLGEVEFASTRITRARMSRSPVRLRRPARHGYRFGLASFPCSRPTVPQASRHTHHRRCHFRHVRPPGPTDDCSAFSSRLSAYRAWPVHTRSEQ